MTLKNAICKIPDAIRYIFVAAVLPGKANNKKDVYRRDDACRHILFSVA